MTGLNSSIAKAGKARLGRLILGLWMLVAVIWPTSAVSDVVVVLSDDSSSYQEVVEGLRGAWARSALPAPALKVVALQEVVTNPGMLTNKGVEAIITVGVRAAQATVGIDVRRPVLVALIPKSSFDKLLQQYQKKSPEISAIYLDQPLDRQVALFRVALPTRKRLGVLIGPESQDKLKLLHIAVGDQKIQVVTEKIDSADELLPALQRVLSDADALLALPDQLVFTKNNVQSILLTSYRYQDPVIGYSQAYVKAGALCAVYSTAMQIGQQAGELIQRLQAAKSGTLPAPQYPKYFSVSVNAQVARSLGIQMEDEAVLMEKLKRTMEQQQ